MSGGNFEGAKKRKNAFVQPLPSLTVEDFQVFKWVAEAVLVKVPFGEALQQVVQLDLGVKLAICQKFRDILP